ncbi:MAG: type IV toxin-antitoxin system AbiEi family antitoxin domain-containing protein [Myxococcaceae bacterium]
MNGAEALACLRNLGVPMFTTADAAAVLKLSTSAASHTLRRLARAGLVVAARKGLWALDRDIDPLLLPEHLSAPFPSYVSLQTALFRHGMISQIPSVVYAVTLGRSRRIDTPFGGYSFHHLPPELFGGWAVPPKSGLKLATPEKALADFLYLTPTRTRLFTSLPELELPPAFRPAQTRAWLRRIPSPRLRTIAEGRLDQLLNGVTRRSTSSARPRGVGKEARPVRRL